MAAPTFQAKGTVATGTGSSVSPTYMGSINANDIIILAVFSDGMGTITPPSGYSQISQVLIPFAPSSPTMLFKTYYKVASGSESGSTSVTRSGHTGSSLFMAQFYQFRGDNYLTIEDTQTTGGLSTTITWSAVSVGGTERTLAAIVLNHGTNPGVPSGYSSSATDSSGTDYLELNTKVNVSSDGSVTDSAGSTSGWMSVHISLYNNTPPAILARSFIVN
jgi:hypothetical protein